MGHLGDFGVVREEVTDTFGYFGATLRLHPNLSEIAVFQAFEQLAGIDETDLGWDELKITLATIVHADDIDECLRLAAENRQRFVDVAELVKQLLESVTDRPTELPSGSSDGQPNTDTASEDDVALPALRLLEGRPDLQVAVVQAREARAAAG